MSLIDNKPGSNTGVGNYKGVMLCNRPFAGSVGRATKIILLNLFMNSFFKLERQRVVMVLEVIRMHFHVEWCLSH